MLLKNIDDVINDVIIRFKYKINNKKKRRGWREKKRNQIQRNKRKKCVCVRYIIQKRIINRQKMLQAKTLPLILEQGLTNGVDCVM